MSLNRTLNLIGYNVEMERFADRHGDSLEAEDIQDFAKTLYNLSNCKAVKSVASADNVDDAFDYLDILAQELEAKSFKEAPKLSKSTVEVYKIFAFGYCSKSFGWFDDWDTIEAEISPYLTEAPELDPTAEDTENFYKILGFVGRKFLKLLWDDIKDQKISIVEKFATIKAWRDEYEPNLTDWEGFGSTDFFFESLLNCETYSELLQGFADWNNELVFIEFGEDGEPIYGSSTAEDYLYLSSVKVAIAEVWGAE